MVDALKITVATGSPKPTLVSRPIASLRSGERGSSGLTAVSLTVFGLVTGLLLMVIIIAK